MKESEQDKIRQRYPPRIPYQPSDRSNGTEVQSAIDFIQKIKAIYTESSPIFLKFLEAMKDFKMTKLTGAELYAVISRLFADKPNLVQEFKSFIPQNSVISEENKFLEKINKPISNPFEFMPTKTRLKEKEVMNRFIDLLYHTRKKPLNPQKINELSNLLNEYPELINKVSRIGTEEKEEIYTPFDLIKEKIKNLGIYKEFMKCINSYNQNLISKNDLVFLVKQIIKEEKLVNEFIKFLNPGKEIEKEKKKYLGTVGSYRIVKSEPSNAIINDYCVGCPTHNRENENYVFLKRNIYEENLFRIEDERFEIDLMSLRIELMIVSLEKILLTNFEEIGISQLEISSGIIQSILEMVYKESYSEILEGILSKPKQTIPIVLSRLYKINEKIKREKVEKEKIWEEATKLNYYRALDNIYHDFKSTDKKNLMFKQLSVNYLNKEISIENLKKVEEKIKHFFKIQSENKTEHIETLNNLLEILNCSDITMCLNSVLFSLFCYIVILTERLSEVYLWELEELKFSKMNRELGLIDRLDIEDRKKEIFITIENLLEKKIDNSVYEEEIRILSKNNGYKLFNIDKLFSKLDNKIGLVHCDNLIKEMLINVLDCIRKNELEEGEIIKNTSVNNNIVNDCKKNVYNENTLINNTINENISIDRGTNNSLDRSNTVNDSISSTLSDKIFKTTKEIINKMEIEEYFIMTIRNKKILFEKLEKEFILNHTHQIVEKIRNLDYNPEDIKNKVFLDRTLRSANDGVSKLDLEHKICLNTHVLRHVAWTSDFFMSFNYKRSKKE